MTPGGLTGAELAARAGIELDEVHRLAELGILQPNDEGLFQEWELGVIRLTDTFEEICRTAGANMEFVKQVFTASCRG